MQGNWLSAIVALGLVSGFSAGTVRAAELISAELSLAELSEMEQLLAQLNFDPGAVDGEVDDRTRTAIRLYQEFAILPVDGEPSTRLLRELRQVSQVYAEMREASPAPEPEPQVAAAPDAEPESAPVADPEPEAAMLAEPDPAPTAEVAAVEPPPEAAPEIPEPPNEAEPVAPEPEVAEPEVAEPVEPDAEPEAEPAVAEPAEPEPDAELVAADPAPEPEVAEPVEPDAEPEAEPAVAEPAEPKPDAEPTTAEVPVAEAEAAAPEPEQEMATPAEPPPEAAPKAAPEAAAKATDPPATPKAAAGFNIAGMIARLKQRDHAEAPATSTQAARVAPTAPSTTTDRAGYERTLIWKVQQELRRIGLDPGAADGNLRTRTTSAIATYQRARGLPADGRVNEDLLARLAAEVTPAAPQPQSEATPFGSVWPQAAAIEAAPSNGYQAFQAGYSAAQIGDFGAAVKLYDQAIDGGDLALEHLAAALYNRANAYQYLGVMDKAITDYSAAIDNKPGFPAAYYNRGFAFDAKGEQGRAVEDFRKARDLGLQRLGIRSPDLPPPLL